MEPLAIRKLPRHFKRLLWILTILLSVAGAKANSVVIAQWNFNSKPPDAATRTGTLSQSLGFGSASLAGGQTSLFYEGSESDFTAVSDDNSGWSISSYPPQGTGNKQGGVQFNVNTSGKQNIVIRWQQQISPTASRYSRLQYSTNGIGFIDLADPVVTYGVDAFEYHAQSLVGIKDVNDNTNFAFRIVTEFESTAVGTANPNYVTASDSSYNTAGRVRFDMVTVYGETIFAPVAESQKVTTDENTPLRITLTGSDVEGLPLTYVVVTRPIYGVLSMAGNNLVYAPNANYFGPDSFDFTVNNGTFDSTPATVEITVNPGNSFPLLTPIPDQMLNEGTTLVITNTASDSDLPANTLTFSLVSPPAGMSIDPGSGVLTWTPTEAQGSSTNVITVRVTDNGTPSLSDTKRFTVIVAEVNSAPVLPFQTDRPMNELTTLVVTNAASDGDIPAHGLTYQLVSPPAWAKIDARGFITLTPKEADEPGTNTIMTVVTDNGAPPLSATNSFMVTVNEVNSAPVLPAQSTRTLAEQTVLTVTNKASDADIPANVLTYQLVNPPTGASIDARGVFTWTPSETQGPSTNLITTVVSDDGE